MLDAELTGGFFVLPYNLNQSVEIRYTFEWTTSPIFRATDNVVIAWVGCDKNSYPLTTSVTYEEHKAEYYFNDSNSGPYYTLNNEVKSGTADKTVKIKMAHSPDGVGDYYAKRIWGNIRVQTASGTSNLSNIIVAVGYGHTVVGVSASPSVDVTGISVGINFAWNQQDLYNVVRNYKSNGALVN